MFRLCESSDEDMIVANILERFSNTRERNRFIVNAIFDYANSSGRDYVISQHCSKHTVVVPAQSNRSAVDKDERNPKTEDVCETNEAVSMEDHCEENNDSNLSETELNTNDDVLQMILNKLGLLEDGFNTKLSEMEERLQKVEVVEEPAHESELLTVSEETIKKDTLNQINNDNKYDEKTELMDESQVSYADINTPVDIIQPGLNNVNEEFEETDNEFDRMIDRTKIGGAMESLFNLYNDDNY